MEPEKVPFLLNNLYLIKRPICSISFLNYYQTSMKNMAEGSYTLSSATENTIGPVLKRKVFMMQPAG